MSTNEFQVFRSDTSTIKPDTVIIFYNEYECTHFCFISDKMLTKKAKQILDKLIKKGGADLTYPDNKKDAKRLFLIRALSDRHFKDFGHQFPIKHVAQKTIILQVAF